MRESSALPISQCPVIMHTLSPLYSFVLISFGTSTSASIIRIFRVYLQYKRGSQPREASQLLFITFRSVFLVLSTCQILLSLGLGASFILLTFVNDFNIAIRMNLKTYRRSGSL